MDNVIKFEDLEIPALTEVAKVSFEEALWATEKALTKQLEFGRVMLIVKSCNLISHRSSPFHRTTPTSLSICSHLIDWTRCYDQPAK